MRKVTASQRGPGRPSLGGKRVAVRLPESEIDAYAELAAEETLDLSTYLRQCIRAFHEKTPAKAVSRK